MQFAECRGDEDPDEDGVGHSCRATGDDHPATVDPNESGSISTDVTSPIGVEYEITPLGRSLQPPFKALYAWTKDYLDAVEDARQAFDGRIAA